MRLNASKTIDARISGSGEISYTGTAQLNSHISGSGHIHKI